MKTRFRFYLSLAFIYSFFIFYLSSKSSPGDPGVIFDFFDIELLRNIIESIEHSDLRYILVPLYIFSKHPDKLFHIVLYAGFGFLLYFTLKSSSNPTLRYHAFIFAIVIGILYGASDEFHQSFVPGRSASTMDLMADGIGVVIAQVAIFIVKYFLKVMTLLFNKKTGIYNEK